LVNDDVNTGSPAAAERFATFDRALARKAPRLQSAEVVEP